MDELVYTSVREAIADGIICTGRCEKGYVGKVEKNGVWVKARIELA